MEVPEDYHRNELLMKKGQKVLQELSLKKGQKPPTKPSFDELINLRDQIVLRYTNAGYACGARINYITHKYHPSVAPISALKKIYTQDLLLETNHRGSYIILRAVTSPKSVTVVISVAEDENGVCELIQLPVFNVSQDRAPKNFLPEGQVFIVKEPFYKSNASGEIKTGTSICIDHVSDLVLFRPDDIRIPLKWQTCHKGPDSDKTSKDWKDEGNALYQSGKLDEALECYTRGLEAAANESNLQITKAIRLNRSQAFLKLSESIPFYDKAFEDANYVLRLDPTNEKALYRGAKALYLSRKFEDCKCLLTRLLKHHKSKEAKADLLKVFRRLQEERTGSYDFQELRRLTSCVDRSRGPVKLDCADFVGPIQLRDTPNSGRGLFATRDVKFGELLLFAKPFYIDYPQTEGSSLIIDLASTVMLKTIGEDRSVQDIVQMLYNNPSMINEYMQLHGGDYGAYRAQTEYVDGKPIIDTFLVSEIRRRNAHTTPVLSTATDSISLANADPEEVQKAKESDGTGIGIMSSFFNHACWSQGSARRTKIGDMLVIRAAMDIKKDQQITVEYHNVGGFKFRQQALAHNWGFACECDLCKVESEEPPNAQKAREEALEMVLGFKSIFSEPTEKLKRLINALPEILKWVSSLEGTYKNPPSKQPRYMLVTALEFLLGLYDFMFIEGLDCLGEVIATVKHILKALGYEIKESYPLGKVLIMRYGQFPDHIFLHDHAVECSMAYSLCGNYLMAKAWQELAADFYEVDFGERASFFERFEEPFADAGYELKAPG